MKYLVFLLLPFLLALAPVKIFKSFKDVVNATKAMQAFKKTLIEPEEEILVESMSRLRKVSKVLEYVSTDSLKAVLPNLEKSLNEMESISSPESSPKNSVTFSDDDEVYPIEDIDYGGSDTDRETNAYRARASSYDDVRFTAQHKNEKKKKKENKKEKEKKKKKIHLKKNVKNIYKKAKGLFQEKPMANANSVDLSYRFDENAFKAQKTMTKYYIPPEEREDFYKSSIFKTDKAWFHEETPPETPAETPNDIEKSLKSSLSNRSRKTPDDLVDKFVSVKIDPPIARKKSVVVPSGINYELKESFHWQLREESYNGTRLKIGDNHYRFLFLDIKTDDEALSVTRYIKSLYNDGKFYHVSFFEDNGIYFICLNLKKKPEFYYPNDLGINKYA